MASSSLYVSCLLVLACLLSARADGPQNVVNFIFEGMIPANPGPSCPSSSPCPTPTPCATCVGDCPAPAFETTPNSPSIFASLTEDEIIAVRNWLYAQEVFDLTPFENATLEDNYIFLIDLQVPNKSDALSYLDQGGPTPARYAHAVLYLGQEERVREISVGPIPVGLDTSFTYWDDENFLFPIPFNSRIVDSIEYAFINDVVMLPLSAAIHGILLESFNSTLDNCTTPVCLTYTDSAPRANDTHQNSRQTWFQWTYYTDSFYIQSIGLETLVYHNSTNPDDFHLLMLVYNGQNFSTAEEFAEAYYADTIEKISITPDIPWSTFERSGPVRNLDDRVGSQQYEPDGKRFTVSGNHIEWLGWAFDWNTNPITGVALWDIRFLGDRIVYELSMQELLAPYTGYGPFQSNSIYFDTAWGYGDESFALLEGVDCPSTAAYYDVVFAYQSGNPYVYHNAMCIFERDEAAPIRRHFDSNFAGGYNFYAATPDHSLVLRTMISDYNYDYQIDFVFHLNGALEVDYGASGYLQGTYALPQESLYGSKIGPYTYGSLHQHILGFKVDVDVLGTQNTLRTTTFPFTTIDAPWYSSPKSRPTPTHTYIQDETSSAFTPDTNNPTQFDFVNGEQVNQWGEVRAYRFQSTGFIKNLYVDLPEYLLSGSWSRYNIAVTKRHENESTVNDVYAQARPWNPPRTLNSYFNGENLIQEDLVAWVCFGVIHYPDAEDRPVTTFPTSRANWVLRPFNYFDVDPSQDLLDTIIIHENPDGSPSIVTGLQPAASCVPEANVSPFNGVTTYFNNTF